MPPSPAGVPGRAPEPPGGAPSTTPRSSSLRRWGVLLCALVFSEGALGVASAGARSQAPSPLLFAHVGLGVGVVGTAGFALLLALRVQSRPARIVTLFTAAAVGATGLTGAIFLLTGFAQGAVVDRALALVSVAGTLAMVAWGSVAVPVGP